MSYGGGVSRNNSDAELGLFPAMRKTRLSGAERKAVVGGAESDELNPELE